MFIFPIFIFLVALFISLVMIPPLSNLAIRFGGIDIPDVRKVHTSEIPRLGGIAIFCAFIFAVIFISNIDNQAKGFLAGSIVIFLTGVADDLTKLSPRDKFIGEFMAVVIGVVMGGIALPSVGDLICCGELRLGVFAVPFTVFAVVGVINAINLIDGLDGLAGGISAIACIAFGILSYKTGNIHLLSLSIALLGAIVGFLFYNTYPAKIFMGDSGSLFIGYCLGFFSIMLVIESKRQISPVTPLVILGVPIIDTLFVMVNRLKRGDKLHYPDKTHIHHRLMGLGIGHKFTVILVYGLTYLLTAFALVGYRLRDFQLAAVLLLVAIIFYSVVHFLTKMHEKGNIQLVRSNQSLRETRTYRKLVELSRYLKILLKYLLIFILILPLFISDIASREVVVFSAALLILSLAFFFSIRERVNLFFQVILYLSGAFIIYLLENFGRATTIFGCPLLMISNGLFCTLFLIEGVKIFLRRHSGRMINSPLEYLILLIVISMPLLPVELTQKHHLMTVAAKSVILFVAYKLILMRQARRNRKIILATSIALMVIIVRCFIVF
jgi:UDP-GlcNAc:undecaprenyl-phosphate/decaprenyl-phosphate GlcNAc-1-phosphate transferase